MEDPDKEEGEAEAAWAVAVQAQEDTASAHPAATVSLIRQEPRVTAGHVPSVEKT